MLGKEAGGCNAICAGGTDQTVTVTVCLGLRSGYRGNLTLRIDGHWDEHRLGAP
jgi:hypothetical protein